jgi:hypothetical protein
MRTALLILLLASSALSEDRDAKTRFAPGCGPSKDQFEVKTDKRQSPAAQLDAGKALVYLIEDDTNFLSNPKPTTRVGMDGAWVGATHNNSYFFFPVEPGEHHLCASWQSRVILGAGYKTAVAHFTAEAGSVYYFTVRSTWHKDWRPTIELGPLDSDQGQLLTSTFSFSTFHPKR